MYIYLYLYIYAYVNIYIYIYIYAYMQINTTNNHAQATGAVRSYSQHDVTAQWRSPEATVDFYQEISQHYKNSITKVALPTAIHRSNPMVLYEGIFQIPIDTRD